MASSKGTWVEYRPSVVEEDTTGDGPRPAGPVIVRPFSSELAALRAAVAHNNGAVLVEWGDTIEEALAKAEQAPPPPRQTRPRSSAAAGATS